MSINDQIIVNSQVYKRTGTVPAALLAASAGNLDSLQSRNNLKSHLQLAAAQFEQARASAVEALEALNVEPMQQSKISQHVTAAHKAGSDAVNWMTSGKEHVLALSAGGAAIPSGGDEVDFIVENARAAAENWRDQQLLAAGYKLGS